MNNNYQRKNKPFVTLATFAAAIMILTSVLSSSLQGLAAAQQSGYNLTVRISGHSFGKPAVNVNIITENGYRNSARVSTAGDATAIFQIPPDQGRTIQVCVNAGFFSSNNCQRYITTGSDISVSLRAP